MQADIQTTSRRESIGQNGNAGEGSGLGRWRPSREPSAALTELAMAVSNEGLELIRQLEGCRLVAYPDPGSGGEPWTVGYGHTGPEVTPGLVISLGQAEAWLLVDVAEAERSVDLLLAGVGLNRWQQEALVSFCFNVGAGALADSSLRRRLLAGEDPAVVLPEELPRWVKGANGPLAGLIRRRQLELAHSRRGEDDGASEKAAPIELLAAVRFHQELEHQVTAWQELQASLSAAQLEAFARRFRQDVQNEGPPMPVPLPPLTATTAIELPVPYYAQNDSSTGQGPRMCFSSSCAMAAEFLRPGCLTSGPGQPDDRYLAIVQRHGDTTDAQAQIQALAELGITARLRTDGRMEDLITQLQRRIPVPVGWLHKGPVQAPSGGGHWSVVVGWDPQRQVLRIHDPNGEADLTAGGYVSDIGGKGQLYSRRNWGRRWMVEGDGSGWWLELSL